jgi:predicted dehydrogenase
MTSAISRRQFLHAGAAVPLTTAFTAETLGDEPKKDTPPSEKLTLGFIGMGVMNRGHLNGFVEMKDVQVLAVSDVVAERALSAKQTVEKKYNEGKKGTYKGCDAYADFRKIIDRKDIDAIVCATPDHWHAIVCLLAARAKKDIY